jgi:WD40 repeat protein
LYSSVGVGKGNGEIKLYDHETQKLASILTKSKNPNMIDGHKSKVFSIVNHPLNPQEFISGGWDGEIHIWDARCPHSIRRIQVKGYIIYGRIK